MPGPKLMNLEWRIYFNKEIFDSNVVKKIIDFTAKTKLSKSIDGLKFHHFHEFKWFLLKLKFIKSIIQGTGTFRYSSHAYDRDGYLIYFIYQQNNFIQIKSKFHKKMDLEEFEIMLFRFFF